jgi:hypothetical protein
VEIAFSNKALRQLCEKESKARELLGVDIARKLKSRMADISAASSVGELAAGDPRPSLVFEKEYLVDLSKTVRVVFCSAHIKAPLTESGNVDWSSVHRIKILRVEVDDA